MPKFSFIPGIQHFMDAKNFLFSHQTLILFCILCLQRYPLLPKDSAMAMGRVVVSNIIVDQTAASLQGFHAGSDQTGRFASKGKITCWKIFASASEDVVQASVDLGS